jgi:hypothetical protein
MLLSTLSAFSFAAVVFAVPKGNTFSLQVANANSGSAGDLFGKKVIAAGGSLYVNYPNNAVSITIWLATF